MLNLFHGSLGRRALAWPHLLTRFTCQPLSDKAAPGLPQPGYLPSFCVLTAFFSLAVARRWCHGSFIQLCRSHMGLFNCTIIKKTIVSVAALWA